MKYLCWIDSEILGGCEEYALRIVQHAHALGWDVEVVCVHEEVGHEFGRRLMNPEIRIHTRPIPVWLLTRHFRGWRPWVDLAFCVKFFLLNKPGVVHLPLPWHECGLPVILACAWLKRPLLVTFQLVGPGRPPQLETIRGYQKARRSGVKFCAVSNQNRILLQEYYVFDRADIPVIPNRPATGHLQRMSVEERQRVRSDLGLPDGSVMILTVGGLRYQKGHDLIVQSIREISSTFPQAVFVWAGDGECRESLARMAGEYGVTGRIRMLGHRQDIPKLLGAADLFLFPTRMEGESFALTEAASLETPIVSSNASGIGELLRDGEHALLFKVDDPSDLARAVVAALSDREGALRRARSARLHVNAYTGEDMMADTFNLLKSIARKPRALSA